jgi:hypothetical protein
LIIIIIIFLSISQFHLKIYIHISSF